MPQYMTKMDITYTVQDGEEENVYTEYDQTKLEDADGWEQAIFFSKQHYTMNAPANCVDVTFANESATLINN